MAFAQGFANDTTHNPTIVYDSGNLYYDADGVGSGAAVKFAHLDGSPTLTVGDLFIY